jgi:hypothetical protein
MAVPQNFPHRLTIQGILAWADAHHRRKGKWPNSQTGPIDASPKETWLAVDSALRQGSRGLVGGSSLARLLAKRRGVQNRLALPPLTIERILAWADAHQARTGRWPTARGGPVESVPGEAWGKINAALKQGHRGLLGGSSLARLLAQERGVQNSTVPRPRLTVSQILAWADAHHARTARWPTSVSGPVEGVPGEAWGNINAALKLGHRGFPGGSSLARLLEKRRGVEIRWTIPQILAWADAHHKRTGKWPLTTSGPVVGASRGTWCAIDRALRRGSRGLPGGSSLAALLIEHRGYEGKLRPRVSGTASGTTLR